MSPNPALRRTGEVSLTSPCPSTLSGQVLGELEAVPRMNFFEQLPPDGLARSGVVRELQGQANQGRSMFPRMELPALLEKYALT